MSETHTLIMNQDVESRTFLNYVWLHRLRAATMFKANYFPVILVSLIISLGYTFTYNLTTSVWLLLRYILYIAGYILRIKYDRMYTTDTYVSITEFRLTTSVAGLVMVTIIIGAYIIFITREYARTFSYATMIIVFILDCFNMFVLQEICVIMTRLNVLSLLPSYSTNIIGSGRWDYSVITDGESQCVICLSDIRFDEEYSDENIVILNGCNHVYHENCIVPWLQRSSHCPLCRSIVNVINDVNENND